MNKITKILIILVLFLTLGINVSMAQNSPQFVITWNSCEVETANSIFKINYAIIEVPGPTVVVPFLSMPLTATVNVNSQNAIVDTWGCDQISDIYHYIIYAKVELYAPGETEPYCTG